MTTKEIPVRPAAGEEWASLDRAATEIIDNGPESGVCRYHAIRRGHHLGAAVSVDRAIELIESYRRGEGTYQLHA